MFDIRFEGKLPIYEQLYNGISHLISSGELSPEEKLPTVREVAKRLGINPNTVQKTYGLLEQAGLIYSIPAKGSYISPGSKAAEALLHEAERKIDEELVKAKKSGVTKQKINELTNNIWGDNYDRDR